MVYTPTPTPHLTITDQGQKEDHPKPLGTVTLTKEQVTHLDATLRFFREHNGGGHCTTSDTLEVTVYRDGKQAAREMSQDGTCSRGIQEDADPKDLQVLRQFPTWKKSL